jgi:hypothetical protein
MNTIVTSDRDLPERRADGFAARLARLQSKAARVEAVKEPRLLLVREAAVRVVDLDAVRKDDVDLRRTPDFVV